MVIIAYFSGLGCPVAVVGLWVGSGLVWFCGVSWELCGLCTVVQAFWVAVRPGLGLVFWFTFERNGVGGIWLVCCCFVPFGRCL